MKRVIALLMSLVMMLLLVACGSKPAEESKPAAPEQSKEEVKEEAKTDAEPIVIGMYASQTGSSAKNTVFQVNAAKMAMEEINAAGGINGRPLEMILYDDASTPEGAVKAVTRLIENDGVDAIIGGIMSPNIAACKDITENAKVLNIGAGTGVAWTNIGAKYLFRGTVSAALPIASMLDTMVDAGMKAPALMSSSTEYGQSGRDTILAGLESRPLELKADIVYQATDTDYTGQIAQVISSGCDCVIQYGDSAELTLILRQLRQAGYTGLVFTVEGAGDRNVIEIAGPAADGVVFCCAYIVPPTIEESTSELMEKVLTNYVDTYGELPQQDTVFRGYDQMYLVAEALKNSADPEDRDANREAFINIKGFEGLAGTYDFSDESGDGLTKSNTYMILDGKHQAYDLDAINAWLAEQ